MKRSKGERMFSVFNYIFLVLLAFITLYPFAYVLFASFSDPVKIMSVKGALFWPVGFSLSAYKKVFSNSSIYIGYGNTIFYVVVGTMVNIVATATAAYVLSRKNLMLKRFFTLMFIFTMYFNGGLIPSYLLMNNLKLVNTRMGLILPVAVSTYNLLIMITGFQGISSALEESARIDGANNLTILTRIILPLAKPTIMVIMLYYAVGHWNAYFRAMIYIRDSDKMPLQLFLRDILTRSQLGAMSGDGSIEDVGTTIKYATILVSTVPILCIYPLIQKHFVQGVMIGAVKE
ncbi:MAG: carbohydrate ABC transporter permease [Anaerolineaceae bacterium]|nr:MAG: carbohydrate ABC transporter permease [Anaerolineaceae bacterium]